MADPSTFPRPTVAVLGASRDPRKFGHRSVVAHLRHGYTVYPINPQADHIAGIPAYSSLESLPVATVDRISVYLPAAVTLDLLPQIAARQPREVWFNPGSESPELIHAAEALGLPVIVACSIVDVESH